ncbi:MAG: sugar kinase [Proteobacteria bacterium]|nr:sugar kinase [Pseudomonadota bacterium]
MSLLVVGSVALDDIEAPAGSVRDVLGGAACYSSVAASYFTRVLPVGVAGRDFPPEHLQFLASKGIDVSGIESAPGPTFRWGGRYGSSLNQRDTLFTELGVFERFQPRLSAAQRRCGLVFLANIHPGLQRDVLEQAARPRFTAMDSMNLWIETAREELVATIRKVDCLIVDEGEARLLTGEVNVVRAGESIRALGPRVGIVKRGEHGALLFDDEGVFAAPAFPLSDPADPTGAGDCFAGAFMGSLAGARRIGARALRRAMAFGTVVASFCVERFSLDRFRSLDRSDIDARFAAYRELTRL